MTENIDLLLMEKSDEEIRYDSLIEIKKKKLEERKNLKEKENETLSELQDIENYSIEYHLKKAIYLDALEGIIEDSDDFIGDNSESLSGKELETCTLIRKELDQLEYIFLENKKKFEILEILKSKYEIQLVQLDEMIDTIDKNLEELYLIMKKNKSGEYLNKTHKRTKLSIIGDLLAYGFIIINAIFCFIGINMLVNPIFFIGALCLSVIIACIFIKLDIRG